jgi:hypothetical protein
MYNTKAMPPQDPVAASANSVPKLSTPKLFGTSSTTLVLRSNFHNGFLLSPNLQSEGIINNACTGRQARLVGEGQEAMAGREAGWSSSCQTYSLARGMLRFWTVLELACFTSPRPTLLLCYVSLSNIFQIFKHHISVVEGHLRMVEMIQKHTVPGTGNYTTIHEIVERTQEMLSQSKQATRSFVCPNCCTSL